MDFNSDKAAALFFERAIRIQVATLRRDLFRVFDELKTVEKDNYEHLVELLKDEELAKCMLLFQENRSKAIRKDILDWTNSLERNLLDSLENYDIKFKPGTQLQGLLK